MWGKWRLIAYSFCAVLLIYSCGIQAYDANRIMIETLQHGERADLAEILSRFRRGVGPLSLFIPIALLVWHRVEFAELGAKAPFTLALLVFGLLAMFLKLGDWLPVHPGEPLAQVAGGTVVTGAVTLIAVVCAWFWMLNLSLRATRVLRERDGEATRSPA